MVILGDVAEHMTADDALRLWQRAADAARRAVYLSIPIVRWMHHQADEGGIAGFYLDRGKRSEAPPGRRR